MGLIGKIFSGLFGGGRNVIADTVGVFRENSEAGAQRQAEFAQAALAQFGAEFLVERKGWFDRFMDGLNRFPRPLMVVSLYALFASAMFDPVWFSIRMQGLALVPEPIWWGAGTIMGFYFAGRAQFKAQEFRKSVASNTAMVPQVMENISRLRELRDNSPGVADTGTDAALTVSSAEPAENPAVQAWREQRPEQKGQL